MSLYLLRYSPNNLIIEINNFSSVFMQFLVSIMQIVYHFLKRSCVIHLILYYIYIFIYVDNFILIRKNFCFMVVTDMDDRVKEIMYKFYCVILHFKHPKFRKHKKGFFFFHPLGFFYNLLYSFFFFIC